MERTWEEGGRTVERRTRQEKEELLKLRRRADDLVRKAYFRYAGANNFALELCQSLI